MSAVGASGQYISDASIMEWLAQQQDRIYGDLRESMDLSETRAAFTDKLNNIKADLEAANKSHDFSKVDGELQDFMKTYGSEPGLSDLCEGLQAMVDQVHSDYSARVDYPAKHDQWKSDSNKFLAASLRVAIGTGSDEDRDILARGMPDEPQWPGQQGYDDGQMKSWDTLISGKTDVASKNDQLTMIHIQELKATLDQGAQLGSTFISSGDKTSSAIINNIA